MGERAYSIFVPKHTNLLEAVDKIKVVPQKFHIFAFLFNFFWLVWHRLWLEAAVFAVIAFVALEAFVFFTGAETLAPFLTFALSLFLGLEADALKERALERRQYKLKDVVFAGSKERAVERFLARQL